MSCSTFCCVWCVRGSKGGHIIIIGTHYWGHVVQYVTVILGGCAPCVLGWYVLLAGIMPAMHE